jgi:hypothetical protein
MPGSPVDDGKLGDLKVPKLRGEQKSILKQTTKAKNDPGVKPRRKHGKKVSFNSPARNADSKSQNKAIDLEVKTKDKNTKDPEACNYCTGPHLLNPATGSVHAAEIVTKSPVLSKLASEVVAEKAGAAKSSSQP